MYILFQLSFLHYPLYKKRFQSPIVVEKGSGPQSPGNAQASVMPSFPPNKQTNKHTYSHTYTQKDCNYIYIYIYKYMCVYVYVCVYMCVCVCLFVCLVENWALLTPTRFPDSKVQILSPPPGAIGIFFIYQRQLKIIKIQLELEGVKQSK